MRETHRVRDLDIVELEKWHERDYNNIPCIYLRYVVVQDDDDDGDDFTGLKSKLC